MSEEIKIRGTGAIESEQDLRTVKHEDIAEAGVPLIKGGIVYNPNDILDQSRVGICTAISLIQNREKANGKKYSADFQYLLQKKFMDGAWFEGSSILNALKVGTKYGFLPEELWNHTTQADRDLSYAQYILKLQAISDSEIQRLLGLCVDKIPGYASVNVADSQAIAKAVSDSEAGILCRYGCQKNWWTAPDGRVSYAPKDIDPLRYAPETSGHAINLNLFDYTTDIMQVLANTWGPDWDKGGCADINWSNYKMNEAWLILKTAPVVNMHPTIKLGAVGTVVKELQTILNNKLGCNLLIDGQFGVKTDKQVKIFQLNSGLKIDGVVGPLTWEKLLA